MRDLGIQKKHEPPLNCLAKGGFVYTRYQICALQLTQFGRQVTAVPHSQPAEIAGYDFLGKSSYPEMFAVSQLPAQSDFGTVMGQGV